MAKIDEAVGIKNRYTMDGGGKRLFRHLKRQEFCKFVGCIISEVIYGNKVHKLWIDMSKASCRITPPKLQIDVNGNTDLYKLCCDHYRHFYIYTCH